MPTARASKDEGSEVAAGLPKLRDGGEASVAGASNRGTLEGYGRKAARSVIRLGLRGHSKTSGFYAGDRGNHGMLLKGGVPRADKHSRRFPLRVALRACCGGAQRTRAEVGRPLRRPLR